MSKQQLHYEMLGGMLVRSNGVLRWRCPDCFARGESVDVMQTCPNCSGEHKPEGDRQ